MAVVDWFNSSYAVTSSSLFCPGYDDTYTCIFIQLNRTIHIIMNYIIGIIIGTEKLKCGNKLRLYVASFYCILNFKFYTIHDVYLIQSCLKTIKIIRLE